MAEKSNLRRRAEDAAGHAWEQSGSDHQTEVLGAGLAAVAFALLEVAAAIRESADARD